MEQKILNLSKGKILEYLSDKLKVFIVPKIKVYYYYDWKINSSGIIKDIQKEFKNYKLLAVRSSAYDEDNTTESQAGVYHSELNVNHNNTRHLKRKIDKVLASYKIKKSSIKKEEFIIQEMIGGINMSGVVFTHDPNSFAPYYIVNYDDVSGKTNTVTSGNSEFSNRTINIYRNFHNNLRSKRFINLLKAVKEIEVFLKNEFLDIEFCVNNDLSIFLLQVRSITKVFKWNKSELKNFSKVLRKVEKKIQKHLLKEPGSFGKTNVFGQMPDWNPAEIIGNCPKPLAYSIYKKLITNFSWAKAREKMDYKNLMNKKLMFALARKPYIKTRLSFNSFLPKKLNKKISEKLVNFWIDRLKKNPIFHDKIETEVAITAYAFDYDKKIKTYPLLKKEKNEYGKILIKHLNSIIGSESEGSIDNAIDKIYKLENIQKSYDLENLNIKKVIKDCMNFGIIPFSILARHAFISISLINSLVKINLLKKKQSELFLNSIKTIATELLTDVNNLINEKINKKEFLKKYGHLRPGTYDILSKRYDQSNYFNLTKIQNSKSSFFKNYKFPIKIIKKIKLLLKKKGFENISTDYFLNYIRRSVSLREYSKFIFTKNVSILLKYIEQKGRKIGLKPDDLSYLSVENCINMNKINKRILKKIIKINKKKQKIAYSVKLPQIISDTNGAYVAPYQMNTPNYITRKKIISNISVIKSYKRNIKLNNKIIVIENADPGYDWIFTYKIAGLITKFGGVNSHMAIRCREFDMPAAIGCGEYLYNKVVSSRKIVLDCSTNKIDILDV